MKGQVDDRGTETMMDQIAYGKIEWVPIQKVTPSKSMKSSILKIFLYQ